jgi:hypothetical protein
MFRSALSPLRRMASKINGIVVLSTGIQLWRAFCLIVSFDEHHLIIMKCKFTKTFGSLCLSVLFAYSSIAWAFDECSQDGAEQAFELAVDGKFASPGLLDVSTRSSEEPVRTVHCIATYHAFDVIASSFRNEDVRHAFKDLSSTSFRADSLLPVRVFNALNGRSPPGWIDHSFASGQRSRYLVLSVFLV